MIITKTPLRASLFGGGTDFHDYFRNSKYGYGSVISAAIDMHVYIIVSKRFDDKIRLVYQGNELVDTVDEVKHNIIREALKIVGVDKGVEILYLANLPMTNLGLGLASSSALAVGVLHALHAYKNETVTKEQLAREAVDLEINHLGAQIGIQDQYAVSYGGFNRYYFNSDDSVTIKRLDMDSKLIDNLLLFYTGSPRDSKEIFKEQKKTTLNKSNLFDNMIEITNKANEYIEHKDYDKLGILLNDAWQIKKEFSSKITNIEIDNMYNKAIKAGALGGKILGAGGGGFLMLYVPKERQDNVIQSLKDYKQIPFKIDYDGSQIVYRD